MIFSAKNALFKSKLVRSKACTYYADACSDTLFLFLAGGVARHVELVEQVDQADQVGVDGGVGEGLCRVDAGVHPVGGHQQHTAHQELDHLRLGEELLQAGVEAQGGKHVIRVHERVDEGVEGHQNHAGSGVLGHDEAPRDNHDSSVVVGLQEHRLSAFKQNNPEGGKARNRNI